MKKVVFYSWQSDLSNATNRGLIENALNAAAKEIVHDESINIEPTIDKDTQGVPGAPDIAATIFGKIAAADIFVADISLVLKGKRRSSPNPNVLIELGYALKALGHERIILVFNEASGKKEDLPFDLKTKRVLMYKSSEADVSRSEAKTELTKKLKEALLVGFAHSQPLELSTPIVDIIKNTLPSKKIDLRAHLERVLKEVDKLQPPMMRDGGTPEQLIESLSATVNLVADFAILSETVVLMDDIESAKEIFQWFGKIAMRYHPRSTGPGTMYKADGDYFKFVGHELFVVFITPFVREQKWKELRELLKGTIRIGPTHHYPNERKDSWTELCDYLPSLAEEGKKRGGRMSLHADILKERHEKTPLLEISPFTDFAEADFFLHLHGTSTREEYHSSWYPQSVLWLDHTPRFLAEAEDYPAAMAICDTLGISDIEELKKRLRQTTQLQFARRASPFYSHEIDNIGSQGGGALVFGDN